MKKQKILLTICMICVLLFGSVITTQAASTGARATRFGLTTAEGNYIAYNDMSVPLGYDNILASYQSDTYKDYTKYTIMYLANEKEENYWITFCRDQDSITYSPNKNGDKYIPRLKCTTSLIIIFACKHDLVNDTWEVQPTSSAPALSDPTYYTGYDMSSEESMRLWTKQHIYHTTADILESDGKSVFYLAPKLVLAPVVGEIPMKGATAQILAMIPICLALLVGYRALRKALAILQTILHNA